MSWKARVAVVGAGWWASKAHIPSLATYEHAELTAIVDPDEEKMRAAGDRTGVTRLHGDYRDLYTGDIDGVVVAVPHAYHYEIARASLDAGLHVLIEKPMVLKAVEARDLVQRAEVNGLHLMVGYTFHFTRHTQLARALVQSGRLGDVMFVSALFASSVEAFYRGKPQEYEIDDPVAGPLPSTYRDPAIAGGGQGQTQVTHAIDIVFWITGLCAAEVTAYMASFHLEVDLVDAICYQLSNGGIGTMGATGSIAPGMEMQEEFRYYGTEGVLLHDLAKGKLSFLPNDGEPEVFPDLVGDEIYPDKEPARGFVDTILGTRENPAPGRIAAYSVEFLEAAYRSARDARPVRIDELFD
jgi:predicted dehydrogenase